MNWPLGQVQEIADVISGYAFKSTWFGSGSNKIIRIGDLQNGVIESDSAVVFDETIHKVPDKFKIKPGDILMALSGATVGKIAVAQDGDAGTYLNQRVAIVRGKTQVSSDYLKHVFSGSPLKKLLLSAGGAAQPNLSPKDLASMEIPLPSSDQQKRIAAILDKADAIRRKRQQAIQLADEFLRSVFLNMFGDPITNPKGWEVKPLAEGVRSIKSGWSAKGADFPCNSGQVGVLKISAVTSGVFKPSENKFVDSKWIPEGKSLLFPKKGDLLFSRANTRELVAATCIVPEDRNDVFLPDKLWSIETDKSRLLPEFLHFLIQHPRFRDRLTSQATGTSGSMLNISKGKFDTTEAVFPNIDQQKVFKDFYWSMQNTNSRVSQFDTEVSDCFNSLSQRAFAGTL